MLLRLLADGDGSSGRGQPEASPPFPAPPPTWRMAAGSGPLANGADSSAPSPFLPGFGTNVMKLIDMGRRRWERRTFNDFNNKINKHNRNAAAPHGRLPHTKHKLKIQAWSSLLFHCCHSSFNPSEAPPWDSRPVSGAGVVHYQLLHRPRSVPTALGPAPLVTIDNSMSRAVPFIQRRFECGCES